MKKFNRHGLVALIVSSLALLAIFEVFWIKKLYEEQFLSLKKDLDHNFRSTVMALQDSMIQGNFGDLPKPTIPSPFFEPTEKVAFSPPKRERFRPFDIQQNNHSDDTIQRSQITFVQKNNVRITIASDSLNGNDLARIVTRAYMSKAHDTINMIGVLNMKRDSLKLKTSQLAVTNKFESNTNPRSSKSIVLKKGQPANDSSIFIKLRLDSLHINEIVAHFEVTLNQQKIDLPFKIHRLHQNQMTGFSSKKRESISEQYEGITTNPVFAGIPKFNVYLAQFPHYQAFLFRKIVPQVLFSLLLFGMTALAFGLVYRSLRQQERLTALKNDFISNITHELKTPIATVSVAIEALQSFNALQKPELTKEYLDISKNELSRLSMLVDKVLKLSVFEQKQPELKKENLDMAALVAQVLDSMRLQFEKMQAKISFDTEGVENTFIEADKVHLTSVIYNLIDNALKYNGKNINISFKENTDSLQLNIEDDGCGIAQEYQSKIFDKFFRVPTGDIHNVKGYGLGLSYVASVVQQHGGKIEVKSTIERGSTFSVFLPKTT